MDNSSAAKCVEYYEAHTANISYFVNATMERMKLRTTILPRRAEDTSSSGGLAVLIRGGSFRGAPSDTLEDRIAAQAECSRSVERHLLRPYLDTGTRVDVFLTVYDSDYCAGHGGPASSYDGTTLWKPYASSLRAITVASVDAAEQLSAVVAALHVFRVYCADYSQSYDAFVLTRFDMRFKASLASFLGRDAQLAGLVGVRFLWHEVGNNWRAAWSPLPSSVERADATTLDAWQHVTQNMIKERDRTFRGARWKQNARVPDTFHLVAFNHTECFLRATYHEMAVGWPPTGNQILESAAAAWRAYKNSGEKAGKGVGGFLAERVAHLKALSFAVRANPGVKTSHLNVSIAPLFPWNHWLHKMLPHLAHALHVDERSHEFRVNRSYGSALRFLVPEGAWSSNPCAGACMLNPFYEFLPRDKWVVDAGMCQAREDFLLDKESNSLCCPAPDYCCPHTVGDCSKPEAILFDASKVPSDALVAGWRRHYYSRPATRGAESVCNASNWNGGAKYPACFWTMDNASTARVRKEWSDAPAAAILEDDDDTHTWHGGGSPITKLAWQTPSHLKATPFCIDGSTTVWDSTVSAVQDAEAALVQARQNVVKAAALVVEREKQLANAQLVARATPQAKPS